LVPNNITCGQFLYVIRKRIKLNPETSLFLFVNGKLPTTSQHIAIIDTENVDEDGFLYIDYSYENIYFSLAIFKKERIP